MVKFIIIRHGYSQFNKEKKFTGQLNIPLDEVGVRQAEETAGYVLENFKIDAIYSSDLIRAYNTAKPIADALNLPIITRKDLRELNLGYWQGKTRDEVKKMFPDSYKTLQDRPGLTVFDGGESYKDVMIRASNAIERIAAENEGNTVVIVSHGAFIRSLIWTLTNASDVSKTFPIPNASVTVINYENKKAEFLITGYNKHLNLKTSENRVN